MNEAPNAIPNDAQRSALAPMLDAGHVFQWLPTGAAAYEAMLKHIERARHSVVLEFYICKPGAVLDRFQSALIAACMRGVRVQLLLDAFGSQEVAGSYWRESQQCGAQLRWFNPLRLLRLTFRNHRKLLVTDPCSLTASVVVTGMPVTEPFLSATTARC